MELLKVFEPTSPITIIQNPGTRSYNIHLFDPLNSINDTRCFELYEEVTSMGMFGGYRVHCRTAGSYYLFEVRNAGNPQFSSAQSGRVMLTHKSADKQTRLYLAKDIEWKANVVNLKGVREEKLALLGIWLINETPDGFAVTNVELQNEEDQEYRKNIPDFPVFIVE